MGGSFVCLCECTTIPPPLHHHTTPPPQIGKHEAIVKNVHDLLAKLAWDFQPQQLDHLFGCFQDSWSSASKKQREKLLALIRRLAEDDKVSYMAIPTHTNIGHSPPSHKHTKTNTCPHTQTNTCPHTHRRA